MDIIFSCLVSNTFLDSNFCVYEFELALHIDMMGKKKRLVVVMDNEVDEAKMSAKLKRYLRKYTYLKRDCVLFMKRLMYRLAQQKLGEVNAAREREMDERAPLLD